MIFDEITNKLDKKTGSQIMDLINQFKGFKTIILVSHDHNNLTQTDYILNLTDQQIIKNK